MNSSNRTWTSCRVVKLTIDRDPPMARCGLHHLAEKHERRGPHRQYKNFSDRSATVEGHNLNSEALLVEMKAYLEDDMVSESECMQYLCLSPTSTRDLI
ncbi:uncharacterized protein LACBIDRAFT_309374 [Laccaria bicolor S238N-H82]|uniref:Predicted protein n=1 Tax=Laccaria bicolor (strain S238N-H82 / ATCC MYA-4686) TaxID=486041 RepID=B0E4Q7_LACBS|nr:uncharacterized protein LACBIDRAFT_309374 [Laccaria bicolor S238N-H82]EDQ98176.1 predicted protein [Laccaria bicolor S238N-H82]|eukprot:XP_001891175.1 predicted protein [Laccaria bicolor S238N-H82]